MFLPKNGDLMQTKAVKLLRFLTQLFTMQSQGCLLLWAQEKFRCKRWTTVGVSQKKKLPLLKLRLTEQGPPREYDVDAPGTHRIYVAAQSICQISTLGN